MPFLLKSDSLEANVTIRQLFSSDYHKNAVRVPTLTEYDLSFCPLQQKSEKLLFVAVIISFNARICAF